MHYPDKLRVRRKTVVPDGQGGQTETWATAISDISCYVRRLEGEERVLNEKLSKYTSNKLYAELHRYGMTSDITISDVLWVTPLNATLSDVYDVESVYHRRVLGAGTPAQIEVILFVRD